MKKKLNTYKKENHSISFCSGQTLACETPAISKDKKPLHSAGTLYPETLRTSP